MFSILSKAGFDIERVRLYFLNNVPAEALQRHLLLIGRPELNPIVEKLFRYRRFPLKTSGSAIVGSGTHSTYSATIVDGAVVSDYGVFTISKNPFELSKRAFVIYGSQTYGVAAAATLLRHRKYTNVINQIGDRAVLSAIKRVTLFLRRLMPLFNGAALHTECQAIVSCSVSNDMIFDVTIIDILPRV